MARFCGNCGVQLEENARVCGQCGTPAEGSRMIVSEVQTVNPKKKGKLWKLFIVLAVVIMITVAGIKIYRSFTGTNGLVRKVMSAYEKYDIDTIVSLSSDIYYYDDRENYIEEYFEYAVGENIDSFEASVGHSYKMSYEVEEIYDLSQRKHDETLKDIEHMYPDFDVDIINRIAVASVKVTAKQDGRSMSRIVKITMSEEGETWRILYLE